MDDQARVEEVAPDDDNLNPIIEREVSTPPPNPTETLDDIEREFDERYNNDDGDILSLFRENDDDNSESSSEENVPSLTERLVEQGINLGVRIRRLLHITEESGEVFEKNRKAINENVDSNNQSITRIQNLLSPLNLFNLR